MKAYAVIGYYYNAALHCGRCARQVYTEAELADPATVDGEGNPIAALFAGDEGADRYSCDDCGAVLIEAVA